MFIWPFEFILLCLASFRLTRLVVYDTITMFIRKPFHDIVEQTNEDGSVDTYIVVKGKGLRYWIGELLSCYWCVGVWMAIILYVGYFFMPMIFTPIIFIFAVAGVAAFLETLLQKVM